MNPVFVQPYISSVVNIGDIPLGGLHPVRLQTMTNTPTLDTKATVAQCILCAEAGADYIRITAPGVREAEHLEIIKKELRKAGYSTPLIADIHFQPAAAEAAARRVEKVRINPGNYVDKKSTHSGKTTEKEYPFELERIHQRLLPLIGVCRQYGTAIRIGSNHGSLSDRIVNRFGDTAEGMAESAMEFLRIFQTENFQQLVLSMKSSNVRVMVESTRLLVQKMVQEGMAFPLHLGVTEAGEGSDGRIKSAAGIGTLLAEGLGDTIRVSLTEAPEQELPVCRTIAEYFGIRNPEPRTQNVCRQADKEPKTSAVRQTWNPERLPSGRQGTPNVCRQADNKRATGASLSPFEEQDFFWTRESFRLGQHPAWVVESDASPASTDFREAIHRLPKDNETPVILKKQYDDESLSDLQMKAACDFGPLFIDQKAQGVWITSSNPDITQPQLKDTALTILQACRERVSKTEYISCPSCGRTLFDLAQTAAAIRERTSHLKGLKIGIMGCIVNGPGEMADADYGYVGSVPGKITLYKGKEVVKKNIPASEAVDELIEIIRAHGDWVNPKGKNE